MNQSHCWQVRSPAPPGYIPRLGDLPPLIAQILYNRGLTDPAQAEEFLGEEYRPGNPFHLRGMEAAVQLLRRAVREEELIAIYGDFDTDGVTATALLVQTLLAIGGRVRPYIPHRVEEGYGLHIEALTELARKGVRLVVTADCGTRSYDEAVHARRLGLQMVITDHHSVPEILPPANAVINPRQKGCGYPFKTLSGVAVAFKLAQGLLRAERWLPSAGQVPRLDETKLLDLVALGTVADLAPLVGENRMLVREGLKVLNSSPRPGLEQLILQAGLRSGRVDSQAISFILAPRLNAAGRLDSAMQSYRLLLAESSQAAAPIAQGLEERNRERQLMTAQATAKAHEELQARGEAEGLLLFLAGPEYFQGIAGLVAGHLVKEFYRPAFVIDRGKVESRGSARSIPEFDLIPALERCGDLLLRYGGHAMAVGFTLASDNLEPFRERLIRVAAEKLAQEALQPSLSIDAEVQLPQLSWRELEALEKLEPFGIGNPLPLFLSRGLEVQSFRIVGSDHLRLTLTYQGQTWGAIAFGQAERLRDLPRQVDLVYSLEADEWNGERRLQLNIRDLRPAEG